MPLTRFSLLTATASAGPTIGSGTAGGRGRAWMLLLLALALWSSTARQTQAETQLSLSPVAPPAEALRLTPDRDGRASFMVSRGPQAAPGGAVTLALQRFLDAEGRPLSISFDADGELAQIEATIGQSVAVYVTGMEQQGPAWGGVRVESGATSVTLPLVVGRFGPTVTAASLRPDGRGWIGIDIRRHRSYGDRARFELQRFRSDGSPADLLFISGPAEQPLEMRNLESRTLELSLPKDRDVIELPIMARGLAADSEYAGRLRTSVGGEHFLETEFTLSRPAWSVNGQFATIQDSSVEAEARLFLAPLGDHAVSGLSVASTTQPAAGFDPRNDLDIALQVDGRAVSLWSLDVTDPRSIAERTLHPGDRTEVLVSPNKPLPVGTHAAVLTFAGLNVAPDKWLTTTVTFTVKRHPAWAVAVLLIAILVSYMITKGLSTALRRRNLRQRIAAIRSTSWLRQDRWGAPPVVRAFGRVAMADRAMRHKHGARRFLRVVTTPELIADLVAEVEAKLPVLERLNRLAIYWKAAPADYGVKVRDVDPMVVRRAQKLLRRIVDQLSQVQDGDEIPADIVSSIEALESWSDFETMEAGYWASLRSDIQLLLSAVQLREFDPDREAIDAFKSALRPAGSSAEDPALSGTLREIEVAAERVPQLGAAELRSLTEPVREQLADPQAVTQALDRLDQTPREIASRLVRNLALEQVPGSFNAMIRRETDYAFLKLLWEQRRHDERRRHLLDLLREGASIEAAFDYLDRDVWQRLKQPDTVQIAPPGLGRRIEAYEPVDLRVACTDPLADTYLFKHGIEYEWEICFDQRKLVPITRSTTVTQFIPATATVTAGVVMRYNNERHRVPAVEFSTEPTSRFEQLWPIPTTEVIGLMISFVMALIAGLQSEAFSRALAGALPEYIALFAWGVAADQTRNLLQNLDKFTRGEDAPANPD